MYDGHFSASQFTETSHASGFAKILHFGLFLVLGTESTGRRRWFHFGVRCVGKEPVRARFVAGEPRAGREPGFDCPKLS